MTTIYGHDESIRKLMMDKVDAPQGVSDCRDYYAENCRSIARKEKGESKKDRSKFALGGVVKERRGYW